MNKSKFFVLFLLITAICLVSFSAVLADQEGNDRWCNSDKYGCWVTGDGGAQSYIVFWSESARELFMGKNSSAPVAPAVPGGKMALTAAPGAPAGGGNAAPVNGGGQQENANGQNENAGGIDPTVLDLANQFADIVWDNKLSDWTKNNEYDNSKEKFVQSLAQEDAETLQNWINQQKNQYNLS